MLSFDFDNKDVPLDSLCFCSHVDVDSEQSFQSGNWSLPINSDICLELLIEKLDGPNRFHVHIERNDNSKLQKATLEEASKLVSPFFGLEAYTKGSAKFQVSKEKLPKLGFVNSLHGLNASSKDATFSMDGASFNVRSKDGIRKVRWIENRDNTLAVDIVATRKAVIGSNYLVEMFNLVFFGLRKFVLEEGPENDNGTKSHLSDSKTA